MMKLNDEFTHFYGISQDELRLYLYDQGAKSFVPIASTWKSCLLLDNGFDYLCVLFRANGVDLKLFVKGSGVTMVGRNRVRFSGGETCRNHYYQAHEIVHRRCKKLVQKFLRGESIHEELRYEIGIAKKSNKIAH